MERQFKTRQRPSRAIDELAWTARYKNPDSAIAYATLELNLAKQIDHKFWQAKACNTLGVSWYIKSDYPKAIEWHQQSLAFMKEMRETGGMATSYNNLGNVYSDKGDFVKALQHYQRALDLVETTNKPKGQYLLRQYRRHLSRARCLSKSTGTISKIPGYLRRTE
jgi:tetratricopeptide (TPR) repeat protein